MYNEDLALNNPLCHLWFDWIYLKIMGPVFPQDIKNHQYLWLNLTIPCIVYSRLPSIHAVGDHLGHPYITCINENSNFCDGKTPLTIRSVLYSLLLCWHVLMAKKSGRCRTVINCQLLLTKQSMQYEWSMLNKIKMH